MSDLDEVRFNRKHFRVLNDTVKTVRRLRRDLAKPKGYPVYPEQRLVVLNEAITAPTDVTTAVATGEATLVFINEDDQIETTGDTVDVVSVWEGVDLEQYTLCVATPINGRWLLTAANCGALASWP